MLPHVAAEDRRAALHQRRVLVCRTADAQAAFAVHAHPSPAAAKARRPGGLELGLKIGETAELSVDRVGQCAAWFAAAFRAEHGPEQRMVGVASAVVAHCTADVLRHGIEVAHQFLDRLGLQLGVAGDGLVELSHIGVVMFAMVDSHGLRVDVRFERVERVREIRECVCHDVF